MRAAQQGVELGRLEVTVDSESDDRGILGVDEAVPAGAAVDAVRVRFGGGSAGRLRAIAEWGAAHCPVYDAAGRAVLITLEVETGSA